MMPIFIFVDGSKLFSINYDLAPETIFVLVQPVLG